MLQFYLLQCVGRNDGYDFERYTPGHICIDLY